MKISTKTYYGLKALAKIASSDEVSPATDIAYSEDIPIAFLEKILQRLRAAGIIESQKGAYGGYSLHRPADKITVSEIFSVLGESISSGPCQNQSCPRSTSCQTKDFWSVLTNNINTTLSSITLADLIVNNETMEQLNNE